MSTYPPYMASRGSLPGGLDAVAFTGYRQGQGGGLPALSLIGWEGTHGPTPYTCSLDLHPTPPTSLPFHPIGMPTLHYTAGPPGLVC